MREPGRIRWRLSEILAAAGVVVSPYDLWTQEGSYCGPKWDLARWGSYHVTYQNRKVHLCCWDTMTDCVRYGVLVGDIDGCMVEIYRKG